MTLLNYFFIVLIYENQYLLITGILLIDINQTLTNSSFTPGNVIYEITPTANGCVGSPIQSTVIVNPIPDAIANPNSQNICSGQSTSINLSGNVLGTTFNWTVNQTDVVGSNPGSGNSINQIFSYL